MAGDVQLHGSAPTRAPRLILDGDGSRLYVVATSGGRQEVGGDDTTEVRAYDLDGATSELAWTKTYDHGGLWLPDLNVSPDGTRVVVVQHHPGDTVFAAYLEVTTHDADDGSILWSKSVMGPGHPARTDYVFGWHHYQSLVFDPAGDTVYVTGSVAPRRGVGPATFQHPAGFLTSALDMADGATSWTSIYESPTGFSSVLGSAIAASPDGEQVFVTGMSELGPVPTGMLFRTHAASTVAYDAATGAQQWVGVDLDRPGLTDSIVVSPDGERVFVVGHAIPDASTDQWRMAVRAYDTDAWLPPIGALRGRDLEVVAVVAQGTCATARTGRSRNPSRCRRCP